MSSSQNPDPWSAYMRGIYLSGKPPEPLGTVVYKEIEQKAREKLKDYPGAFLYAHGSAGVWQTYDANLKAFENFRIVPRMLVDASSRNLETTIFGVTHSSPIFIAPIGVQGIFCDEAEFAPARAARNLKVPFIMSTASTRSIEEVARENGDGYRWYQLYWPKDNNVTLSLLRRAKDNGFKGLVITLDTMNIGWRPHDLETAYLPFGHGVGIEVGRSDPVFMAKHGLQPVTDNHPEFPYDPKAKIKLIQEGDEATIKEMKLGQAWLMETNSGLYRSWEDIKFLRENWDGPLILKGIQHIEDAEKCLEYGIDGIIVSNHGGRQVDGAIPSLYALENIMKSDKIRSAQSSGKLTVLFDSGIRTGSDIIKALALGAQAVLLGRPWVYGATLAGAAGVEQVIKHTMADLDTNMGCAGFPTLADIHGKADKILTKIEL
ncbi:oxidoreductase [Marasmius fiardii PR-910]|nr:oxidoreductase [Marasmius fiardii PR-910]